MKNIIINFDINKKINASTYYRTMSYHDHITVPGAQSGAELVEVDVHVVLPLALRRVQRRRRVRRRRVGVGGRRPHPARRHRRRRGHAARRAAGLRQPRPARQPAPRQPPHQQLRQRRVLAGGGVGGRGLRGGRGGAGGGGAGAGVGGRSGRRRGRGLGRVRRLLGQQRTPADGTRGV